MTTPHNGEPIRYSVHIPGLVKNRVQALHRQQAEAGKGKAFVAAFRKIVERLQIEPLVFGEPSYPLPALQLQVRRAAIRPLIVDYAVHETRPLVFIRGISLLS